MHRSQFAEPFPGQLLSIGARGLAYEPRPLPPAWEISPRFHRLHEQAVLRLGELRAIFPTLPNSQLLRSIFLRREAVLSSRIEGTHTNVEQLMLFETAEPKARKQSSPEAQDAREVLNYVRAMESGLTQLSTRTDADTGVASEEPQRITQWLLRGMHEVLMDGVVGGDKHPGRYRTVQAHIGSSADISLARYVPPPPERIQAAMDNLESFINAEPSLPSLVWIAIAHYQFEAIHPFADGNGRTGRLLIMLMLIRMGLLDQPLVSLSAYLERHREQYNECLWQVSRCGDWDSWFDFLLRGIATEARDVNLRGRRLLDLREQWRRRLQKGATSARLLELIDHLFHSPVMTIAEAQEHLQLTFAGAKKNIAKLEKEGFLVEVTGQQRYRVYVARPIISLLDERPIDQIEG
jgi:Fic family protein